MSIEYLTLAHFRHFSSLFTPSPLYICREPSTNQLLNMQNKPNFRKSQMNLKFCKQMDYENEPPSGSKKTNPNKPNFKLATYSLTGQSGFYIMILNRIINKDFAEVTGAWWCPWSSKPVWG